MKNYLDESERQELLEQHRKERDKRICDRIKAVLLYDKDWIYQRIAEALLISHEGVRQHVLDYEAGRKLSSQNGGSSSKLDEFQKRMLIKHIREITYMNAANEVLVHRFLKGEIAWWDIATKLEALMEAHPSQEILSLETILEVDSQARRDAKIN